MAAPPGREAGKGAGADAAALVIHALRVAAGFGCRPLVERGLRDVCGAAEGRTASCLLRVLVQALALGARRKLRLGLPGAPGLSHDEVAILQMIAAAQHGERALLDAGASWLVRAATAPILIAIVEGLGDTLARAGLVLPASGRAQAVQRPPSARIAAGAS